MTDPDRDAFTGAMYGAHVFLSPWDASPVPGGPTYREIAVAEMRAGEASRDIPKGDKST